MTDYTALIAHVDALNAKKEAWVAEDPDNRWAGLYVNDIDYFQDIGVSTPAEFDRFMDEETLYRSFRDIYNYRPSMDWIRNLSDEELHNEFRRIAESAELQAAQEKESEERAFEEYESMIAQNLELGAADRATAIRWILDSLDIGAQWDEDYICYELGLPYTYANTLKEEAGDYISMRRDQVFEEMMES